MTKKVAANKSFCVVTLWEMVSGIIKNKNAAKTEKTRLVFKRLAHLYKNNAQTIMEKYCKKLTKVSLPAKSTM